MSLGYLPPILAALIAGVVIQRKWNLAPAASRWALLGFGLLLVLMLGWPFVQMALVQWAISGPLRDHPDWIVGISGLVGSGLHALVYLLLLVAIYTGRKTPGDTSPPPWTAD